MDTCISPRQVTGSSRWFRGHHGLSKGSEQSQGFSLFLPIIYSGMASHDPDYEVAKISLVFGVEDTGIFSSFLRTPVLTPFWCHVPSALSSPKGAQGPHCDTASGPKL